MGTFEMGTSKEDDRRALKIMIGMAICLGFSAPFLFFWMGYMYAQVHFLGRETTEIVIEVEELERDIQALDKEVNK